MAAVIFLPTNTSRSENASLVVTITDVRSQSGLSRWDRSWLPVRASALSRFTVSKKRPQAPFRIHPPAPLPRGGSCRCQYRRPARRCVPRQKPAFHHPRGSPSFAGEAEMRPESALSRCCAGTKEAAALQNRMELQTNVGLDNQDSNTPLHHTAVGSRRSRGLRSDLAMKWTSGKPRS